MAAMQTARLKMTRDLRTTFFLIVASFSAILALGSSYYVSSINGNDRNPGTSKDNAWASLDAVNNREFNAGDQILFETGSVFKGQLRLESSGALGNLIRVGKYGDGPKPRIEAEGRFDEAILVRNSEYIEIADLEVTNFGDERKVKRAGVRISIHNFGTARQITLRNLYVHDVNGVNYKKISQEEFTETTGITCDNSGTHTPSRYDGLLIENCRLLRTDRDGIATRSTHKDRESNWFPNLNVVIRGNVIEDIGGDGIVVRGCDGALIERNLVMKGNQRCPDYAAGIWPHSCDNTVIQFNEVCFLKGTLDAMAFDSDGNCRNTTIQYNYSHDNEGGFFMVCGGKSNIGNVIRYNISQNDRHRLIYITGAMRDIEIYNNVVYIGEGIEAWAVWPGGGKNGYASDVRFANNIFYFEGEGKYNFGEMDYLVLENNAFYGNHVDLPVGKRRVEQDPLFKDAGSGGMGFDSLEGYQLQGDSPLAKAGIPIDNNGGRDFWGNQVLNGRIPSIGAFQIAAQSD